MSVEDRQIVLRGKEGDTGGSLTVRHFDRKERAARAARVAALGLLGTACAVFVPIMHFFLVPLGLILTLVLLRAALSRSSLILGGGGSCPFCGGNVAVHKRRDESRFSDVCESCHRRIQIETAQRAECG